MKKLGAILFVLLLVVGIFPKVSFAAVDEKELDQYLSEISTERGFTVTKEMLEEHLSYYDEKLKDFNSVQKLRDSLGEVIKSDLSNLDGIYKTYNLDEKSLGKLLAENDEELNDYIFIHELEDAVAFYSEGGGDVELTTDDLKELFSLFDLSEKEMQNLTAHFQSIEDELSQPETQERLNNLADRMMNFADFETADDLTAGQIEELFSIYNEFLHIFHLKAKASIVRGGTETPLSFKELIQLEELKNANLKISLYNLDGQFLADIIITGDEIDSRKIVDTGKKIKVTNEKVVQEVKHKQHQSAPRTVKGAKLPTTASDYLTNTLIGLFAFAAGLVLFRKMKKAS
ncbi:processed acidic surface protein [Fictibacillus sp. Mic-4]|uniref:processed acidic surface protein n=1 Tax=Fictibacillus sp. Mic-4 TaxID=3132826 RepID=UPI003CF3E9D6